jgi:hypothetical protein
MPYLQRAVGQHRAAAVAQTGIMPRGVQLYVAACPHCAASVPFAAMPVRMIASAAAERALPAVEGAVEACTKGVSRLLGARD